ncbi:FAD-dependent oxidoreductase [Desulfothermus sp.]
MNKKVMVVGGGIAGLSAALELSQKNIQVELVEKSCFLGGKAIGFTCKATDKCQQCGACLVEEVLRDVVGQSNINIHLRTEIDSVVKNGKFKVKLKKSDSIPKEDKVLTGFSKYNSPYKVVIGTPQDSKDGVNIDELGTQGELDVDAIIIATGFTPFDPTARATYGYGTWENVITALELENMLRSEVKVIKPSNKQRAKKIGFIQCVGSRNKEFNSVWCSEVCCPYALRMASMIKYRYPDTEIWIFFIDIQNVGKNYLSFLEQINSEVKFVTATPIDIFPDKEDKVKVAYKDDIEDKRKLEPFDLVVLSVGIMPNEDNKVLSKMINIDLSEDGFFREIDLMEPNLTSQEGIFLAGTTTGPKDILNTISHAKSAVCETLTYLGGKK